MGDGRPPVRFRGRADPARAVRVCAMVCAWVVRGSSSTSRGPSFRNFQLLKWPVATRSVHRPRDWLRG
eukprot:2401261-Prymnesium_polylepis.1